MTTKTKPTQKRDPGKAPAVANRGNPDDPWWYLSRGTMAFGSAAEHDPERAAEYGEMGATLYLLQRDPGFREAVAKTRRKYLGGGGSRALAKEQARTLITVVRACVDGANADPDTAAVEILASLGMLSSLYDGVEPWGGEGHFHKTAERLAAELRSLLADPDDYDPERVAKAALRAVNVRERFIGQLYE